MKINRCNYSNIKFPLTCIVSILTTGCSDMAIMNPKGQIGLEERSLILISSGLMLIVVIPAIIMAFVFSYKFRISKKIESKYSPNWSYSKSIEQIVWTIPILIITVLASLTWKSSHLLDPSKPIFSINKPITIQVVSMNWKWLFIYPKQGIATINEVAFPVHVPIRFEITSDTVMNSFFIPRLGGQIYAMAGMKSVLHLIANQPGTYNGFSSNFSGEGFSGMKFFVIVTPCEVSFHDWINKVKASPNKIRSIKEYERLAQPSKYCSVEYFSKVKGNLYRDIVARFSH